MIGQIDDSTENINTGDKTVFILAFADDIMLLGKNKTNRQVKKMVSYLENVGKHIASDKCSTF